MDEKRIERALRAGPGDEPLYQPAGPGLLSGARRRPSSRLRWFGELALAGGVAAAVLVAVLVVRPGQPSEPSPGDVGLPAHVRSSGVLRVAVSSGSPQVFVSGGSYQGFDIDVARAIGEHLGVAVQVDAVAPAEIERGAWAGRWDLALDSNATTADQTAALALGAPYYWRSAAIVGAAGSGIAASSDLDGKPLCVISGSLAARWLAGTLQLPAGAVARPPAAASAVARPDAASCLAAVHDGSATAYVADWGFEVGTPGPGLEPSALVPFSAGVATAVDPSNPDGQRVLAAVDRAIGELRADGTLQRLSERRFGGVDMTVRPSD
jgi:ABC-type amino acid transport substrate-binding protein